MCIEKNRVENIHLFSRVGTDSATTNFRKANVIMIHIIINIMKEPFGGGFARKNMNSCTPHCAVGGNADDVSTTPVSLFTWWQYIHGSYICHGVCRVLDYAIMK